MNAARPARALLATARKGLERPAQPALRRFAQSSSTAAPAAKALPARSTRPTPSRGKVSFSRKVNTSATNAQAVPAAASTSSSSSAAPSSVASSSGPATPDVTLLSSDSGQGSDRLAIRWSSGIESRYHHVWLRDHCRCPECYHPKTKQRLLDTFSIPESVEPISVESTTEGLQVEWPPLLASTEANGEVTVDSAPTSHHSLYPWRWLMLNSYAPPLQAFSSTGASELEDAQWIPAGGFGGLPPLEKVLWGKSIGQAPPTVTWNEVMGRKATDSAKGEKEAEDGEVDLSVHDAELADRGLLKWLQKIAQYGFCFVSGVPPTPEATEALVRRIAFIRETHYGGFWDFTSNLEHGDTAYTNLKLQAHTDTTYFTDPAGLQLFHLLSHTDGQGEMNRARGGESLLVDGFLAAKILRESNEAAYKTLSDVRIMTHSAGDDDTLIRPLMEESGYPILQHDGGDIGSGSEAWRTGKLKMVRYNNDDRSVLRVKEQDVDRFYKALREWNRILTDPEGEYWQQLTPGTALIFDNHRVLHGRSAFVGNRRLCGAYVSHDDYRSRLAVLRARFGDSLLGDDGRKHGRGVWDDGL